MASAFELNELYSIPGVLAFTVGQNSLVRAEITSPACTAELYLQGAHLAQWKPTHAEQPVLFLSPKSFFDPGRAIRGGVPVIFPWFGARTPEITGNSTEGSQHGFVRAAEWELTFAAAVGEDVHLVLTLSANDSTRALGVDGFRVALEFRLGRELQMRMNVVNEGSQPLVFEEALHTYFTVSDPEQVKILGLAGTDFLDKTDGFKRKTQAEQELVLHSETDRPYLNTTATVTIEDPQLQRRIIVSKSGSKTTVVWNPWKDLASKLSDLGDVAWKNFVCVETANASEDRITLAPSEAHTMEARITTEKLA